MTYLVTGHTLAYLYASSMPLSPLLTTPQPPPYGTGNSVLNSPPWGLCVCHFFLECVFIKLPHLP